MTGEKKTGIAQRFLDGEVLLVDKPWRWTSFDVVNKIKSLLRYRLGIKKIRIGHAGTLDPLATGLLIVCTGKATRSIDTYQGLDKTYTGTFVLGMTTPSHDLETVPENPRPFSHVTPGDLEEAAHHLSGVQEQVPPVFSAKKIAGERAYVQARQGIRPKMEPRTITIHEFAVTGPSLPEVQFRVVCSKGTYIRSLAYDFGERLGTGAYLKELRRTHIGSHSVDDALSIGQVEASIDADFC